MTLSTLEHQFYLTNFVGRKVYNRGEKTGVVGDVVALDKEPVPEVTHLLVHRPRGRHSLMVPWDKINMITSTQVVVDLTDIESFVHKDNYEVEAPHTLLKDHIIDKKVLDFDDNEVEVVYDILMELKGGRLFVTKADVSQHSLWRRMGLSFVADLLTGSREAGLIPWTFIEPLPERIGSFKGNVRLKVLKEKISELHGEDLANILDDLTREQRLDIFTQLDTEQASDTLEAADPLVQRDLIDALKKERVAELLNQMTPAEAADVLGILPTNEADAILKLVNRENASRINYMIKEYDDTILPLVTTKIIKLRPERLVGEVENNYRELAKDRDVNTYLYIVDEKDHLLGIVGVRDLLIAAPEKTLGDIMVTNVMTLQNDTPTPEAAADFARYRYFAIPVVCENGVLQGVVMYHDIMDMKKITD
ncbi:MAG: magnesium transporter [Magnetococcales bacterium]|nr:magnesium transporter [Magnetococcales bacterium]